jgi:hypothetical protein
MYLRLRCSNELRKNIEEVLKIKAHLKLFGHLKLAEKKRISTSKQIEDGIKLFQLDNKIPNEFLKFIKQNKKLPKPLIQSEDLKKQGVQPGKDFGQLLNQAYEAQLNETFKTKKQALDWLKKVSP